MVLARLHRQDMSHMPKGIKYGNMDVAWALCCLLWHEVKDIAIGAGFVLVDDSSCPDGPTLSRLVRTVVRAFHVDAFLRKCTDTFLMPGDKTWIGDDTAGTLLCDSAPDNSGRFPGHSFLLSDARFSLVKAWQLLRAIRDELTFITTHGSMNCTVGYTHDSSDASIHIEVTGYLKLG